MFVMEINELGYNLLLEVQFHYVFSQNERCQLEGLQLLTQGDTAQSQG